MTANERSVARASRRAREIAMQVGEEIHLARLATGLSQQELGSVLGFSHSKVGRIERAQDGSVVVGDLMRLAAAVGLELSVRAFPTGSPHRDHAHAALLDRLRRRLHPALRWRTEVPFPAMSDLRAWDAVIRGHEFKVGVEAETRVRDGQALERRIALKQRDGAMVWVILLLPDTRANRAFVRARAADLGAAFGLDASAVLTALAEGRDPGGDALILL
jgi:transcriptional regulator with XRE-family HTH domain